MGDGLAEYKRFIDGLVERAKGGSVTGQWLMDGDKLYPLPWNEEERRYNTIAQELSSEQRELVAHLLDNERVAAIHDILAFLTWQEYRVTSKGGVELDFEPFGTENFYDFISRMAEDTWPDERDTPSEETT